MDRVRAERYQCAPASVSDRQVADVGDAGDSRQIDFLETVVGEVVDGVVTPAVIEVEAVGSCVAPQAVILVAAGQDVVSVAATQRVVAIATVQPVIAVAAGGPSSFGAGEALSSIELAPDPIESRIDGEEYRHHQRTGQEGQVILPGQPDETEDYRRGRTQEEQVVVAAHR